jgi:hypothetical protein
MQKFEQNCHACVSVSDYVGVGLEVTLKERRYLKKREGEYTTPESPRPLGIPRLAARLTPSQRSVVAVLARREPRLSLASARSARGDVGRGRPRRPRPFEARQAVLKVGML